MRRHWAYLKYVLRHKWFVLLAGRKIGASWWRLLTHDLSKFRPSEWLPYARHFYAPNGQKQRIAEDDRFRTAWLKHQHRNPHHWQHWLLQEDGGDVRTIDMPTEYILEMIADWAGAGRAITGEWEVYEWFDRNSRNMCWSGSTEKQVVDLVLRHFAPPPVERACDNCRYQSPTDSPQCCGCGSAKFNWSENP